MGELFCGAGGLAYGAKQANAETKGEKFSIKHVWAIDNDLDSCLTFRRMITPNKPGVVRHSDIRDIDFSELPNADAIAFGFPCNDFSVVGQGKGLKGKYGPLYRFGVMAIEAQGPKWFIAENVGGIRSNNGGETFKKILNEFAKAGVGYNLTVNKYKFEDYGVPQARHRYIIVGMKKDLNILFMTPAPITKNKNVSAKQALEIPPININICNNEKTKQSPIVIERLKYIRCGENAWNANLPNHLKLNVKTARLSHIYRRLHPDKPSYTITGSGGGGTHVYHWAELRALTNRERARLQTFPDDFVFEGSKESVRRQIGMAVPPRGIEIIFEAILKTFARIPYKHINPSYDFKNPKMDQYDLPITVRDS